LIKYKKFDLAIMLIGWIFLAFREAPEEARVLMGKVNDYDGEIASLLRQLADNGKTL
jgi:hypothetical protein